MEITKVCGSQTRLKTARYLMMCSAYNVPYKVGTSRERIGDVIGGQILMLRSERLREEGRILELYSRFRTKIYPRNVRQNA